MVTPFERIHALQSLQNIIHNLMEILQDRVDGVQVPTQRILDWLNLVRGDMPVLRQCLHVHGTSFGGDTVILVTLSRLSTISDVWDALFKTLMDRNLRTLPAIEDDRVASEALQRLLQACTTDLEIVKQCLDEMA